jgi:hypothetical protein
VKISSRNRGFFNFKGYFSGQHIKGLWISGPMEKLWEADTEYVILINIELVKGNLIYATSLKSKKLDLFLDL